MKLALTALLPLYAAAFVPSTVQNQGIITNKINYNEQMTTAMNMAAMTTAELPEKLYFPKEKEIPKVLGGIKIGLRKLTVITGASSGLGLSTAKTLVNTGRHFVVMACRDVEKGKKGTFLNCFCITS